MGLVPGVDGRRPGMFAWLRPRRDDEAVTNVYDCIVQQSRCPAFYRDLGVADSLDGRFDMLSLHVMLVLRRLKSDTAFSGQFAQALFDHMFVDMDETLREIGVGDLSVGKRVKQMCSAFLGRVAAYDAGLAESGAALEQALARNVYRGEDPDPEKVRRLADYARGLDVVLGQQSLASIIEGKLTFDGSRP
jgi:cytochrome b pre-mRNA-processing protein 3